MINQTVVITAPTLAMAQRLHGRAGMFNIAATEPAAHPHGEGATFLILPYGLPPSEDGDRYDQACMEYVAWLIQVNASDSPVNCQWVCLTYGLMPDTQQHVLQTSYSYLDHPIPKGAPYGR
jgi:hypothetical protein